MFLTGGFWPIDPAIINHVIDDDVLMILTVGFDGFDVLTASFDVFDDFDRKFLFLKAV